MAQPDRIGKYEVLQTIGRGGFATVYKARDPHMKRIVAIKLCASSDESVKKRFLREAEIAGTLDHPAIVRSFECGFAEEGVYLVQEYLGGEDLRPKIRAKAAIPYHVRVGFLLELAAGFAYAHSKGVLHRDIKPGNVRVLPNGQIRILDFGIAKLTNALTVLTKEGAVLGTAGYLPPEQVLGEEVDERADVFGFGALAYELLTYQKPFPGEVASDRLRKILEVTPEPITAFWPDCPPALEALVFQCLEKSPASRCSSFPEVLERLGPIYEQVAAVEGIVATAQLLSSATATGESWESTSVTPLILEPPTPDEPIPVEPPPPAPPSSAGAAGRRGSHMPIAVVAAGAGMLILALVAVLLFLRFRGGSATDGLEVSGAAETPSALAGDAAAAGAAGTDAGKSFLVVDAAPWGEVIDLRNGLDELVDLPADRATPLKLLLPAGDYRAEVRRPGSEGEPGRCTVTLEASSSRVCHVDLERISADDYFAETGWFE